MLSTSHHSAVFYGTTSKSTSNMVTSPNNLMCAVAVHTREPLLPRPAWDALTRGVFPCMAHEGASSISQEATYRGFPSPMLHTQPFRVHIHCLVGRKQTSLECDAMSGLDVLYWAFLDI